MRLYDGTIFRNVDGRRIKRVVARLPSESIAVITFVPGVWVSTMNVAEKVPDGLEIETEIERWVPKSIVIPLFPRNDEPQTVISLPARADEGETEILEGMMKNVVVARLPEVSCAVITLVPGD